MEPDALQLFFAVLTLAAGAGALGLFVCWLLRHRVALAADVLAAVAPVTIWLAWLVAATAMAGSLYFSEVANYRPCTLCWYQRIAMYPLAVILLVAALRRDRQVAWYAVPVAAIGAVVASWHIVVERFDVSSGVCSIDVPCDFVWFERFGFITLPVMALAGFLFVIAALPVLPPQDQAR